MSLRFGLLGLLKYSPMSGYDLKRIFDNSVKYFWSAQASQIYRELNSLENAKLVKSVLEPSKSGPSRRVYSITQQGKSKLKQWLLNMPLETGEDNRNEFLLRIFLSSSVGASELLNMLEVRLEKYRNDLELLKSSENQIPKYREMFDVEPELLYWKIALSRGYHDIQSHIHWAEENIRFLKEIGVESIKKSK